MAMTTAPPSAVLRLGLTLQSRGPSVDGSFLPHGQPPGRPSAPGSPEPLRVAARLHEVRSWGDRRSPTIFGPEQKTPPPLQLENRPHVQAYIPRFATDLFLTSFVRI